MSTSVTDSRHAIQPVEEDVSKGESGICDSFGYTLGQDPHPNHRHVLFALTEGESQRESFVETVGSSRGVVVESSVMTVM